MLQSEYDAMVRHKRLRVLLIVLPILLIAVFSVWLYMDSKKIKPAFKDEATKKAYEQDQLEKSFQKPEELEVQTFTDDELRIQKPEIYRMVRSLQASSSDTIIQKK